MPSGTIPFGLTFGRCPGMLAIGAMPQYAIFILNGGNDLRVEALEFYTLCNVDLRCCDTTTESRFLRMESAVRLRYGTRPHVECVKGSRKRDDLSTSA